MSPPDAHEVAGVLVCPLYVVGNLKENFKSDTPNEVQLWYSMYIHCTHLCVYFKVQILNTHVLDFYSPVAQSWVGVMIKNCVQWISLEEVSTTVHPNKRDSASTICTVLRVCSEHVQQLHYMFFSIAIYHTRQPSTAYTL